MGVAYAVAARKAEMRRMRRMADMGMEWNYWFRFGWREKGLRLLQDLGKQRYQRQETWTG
jgi:hypothetical protein